MYSSLLLEHFAHPRNVGELPPPALTVEASNPACGDVMRLSALVEDGIVTEAAYKVRGCTASIAAGSVLTELMKGRRIDDLKQLPIEEALGGLEPASKHALALCADALKLLLLRARH